MALDGTVPQLWDPEICIDSECKSHEIATSYIDDKTSKCFFSEKPKSLIRMVTTWYRQYSTMPGHLKHIVPNRGTISSEPK